MFVTAYAYCIILGKSNVDEESDIYDFGDLPRKKGDKTKGISAAEPY